MAEVRLKNKETIDTVRTDTIREVEIRMMETLEAEKNQMKETFDSLAQDYDEQIQALEYEISWGKSQKKSDEDEIKKCKAQINELETSIQDLEETTEKNRMHHSFKYLYLITKALSSQKALYGEMEDMRSLEKKLERQHEGREQEMKKKIRMLEKRSIDFEQRMKLVSSTLLNHKRKELIDHKTASRSVVLKIKNVNDKIELAQARKDDVMSELSHMEDKVKAVEMELQELSQTSAIQGGKINTSHARKKRRLDEE